MIASLPMYERPENAAAHDRLYDLIRQNLRITGMAPPQKLTRGANPWDNWRASNLLLSQTCGLPYRLHLHGQVTLLGAPDFGFSGSPGRYHSVIVTRRSDERRSFADFVGARLAVNDDLSQSGWAAPNAHAEALGLPSFSNIHLTGSHMASAHAVADEKADLAALDAISWRMIELWEEFASELHVIDETSPTPGLPYICAIGYDGKKIGAAVSQSLDELLAKDRQHLGGIRSLATVHPDEYLSLPTPPPLP